METNVYFVIVFIDGIILGIILGWCLHIIKTSKRKK